MFGLGIFSGSFAQGMAEERNRLAGERLRVAQAFDQFRRNNPHATLQEFQGFADQVSGGDSYLRGRFPSDEVMSRLAQENAQRKAMDDAERQAGVLQRELQVDRALEESFRRRALTSGDVTRSLEETIAAFGRDPASREALRSRLSANIGDPGRYLERLQFEETERVMPNILSALRQGIDLTPFVQNLPESIRRQVTSRAQDIVRREQAEAGRAAQQAEVARRLQFMQMVLPQVTALMGDPNNTDGARRYISESATALGLRLNEGDADRILGMARAGRDASIMQTYGDTVRVAREAGATRAGEEIGAYQGVLRSSSERAFTSQNDQRRTAVEIIGRETFLTPEQQTAAIEWLRRNGSSSGDPQTMARQLREQLGRTGRLPTLDEYRTRRAGELATSSALPPVQFAPWRDQTRARLTQISEAAKSEIERRIEAGDRAGAEIVLRRAEADLDAIEGDIARRQAAPGWFQMGAGPVNLGQVAELATTAEQTRQRLRTLVPPAQPSSAAAAAATPPAEPGFLDSVTGAVSGALDAARDRLDWQSRLPQQPPPPPSVPSPSPSAFDQARSRPTVSGPPRIVPPTDEEILERARQIRPDFDQLFNPSVTRRRALEEARQQLTNERVGALPR